MAAGGKGWEPEATLLFVVVLFIAIGIIIWFMAQNQILEGLRWVKLAELWVIDNVLMLTGNMLHGSSQGRESHDWLTWLQSAVADKNLPDKAPQKLSPSRFLEVSSVIGSYIRWPIMVIITAMGSWYYYKTPERKFNNKFSLEGLIEKQAINWPVIKPIVNFNPTKSSARVPGSAVPEKLPLFAEALSPEEWIAFNRIPLTNGLPDKEAVRRSLKLQLGNEWRGIAGIPIHCRALLAAFALKGAQKRVESDELLGRLAENWTAEKGFRLPSNIVSEVASILADPEIGVPALQVADRYAYRTTAILGVLRWARERGGVLAPAQFLWLRGEDRALWYPLNNLGRRSYHAEAAGAMAHYMAELAVGKPLMVPRIETAVITFTQYVANAKPIIPPLASGALAKSGKK